MPKKNAPKQVKLSPDNALAVKARVDEHKAAGLTVSVNAVANELMAIGFKFVEQEKQHGR